VRYEISQAKELFEDQRDFFKAGQTQGYRQRRKAILSLRASVQRFEDEILTALEADMGKPAFEAYSSEVGMLYQEIDHTLKWLKDWMRPERPATSWLHFPSSTRVTQTPKGQTLILSPWNYPFLLTMNPLLGSISAGNTAMVKLPLQTPETAKVIAQVIDDAFPREHVCALEVSDEVIIPQLIEGLSFDHIFFTGSPRVGRMILAAAAGQLTPVTLELGGKSPAIVDRSADLPVAARRIIWGKAFNAGQTCIAPDHVWVHESVYDRFIDLMKAEVNTFMRDYGGLEGFTRIIHYKHFEGLLKLLEDVTVSHGGDLDADALKLGLTLVEEPSMDSRIMNEEIFGPILPILRWTDEHDLEMKLDRNPYPLAFYLFSKDKGQENRLLERRTFGGGCLNNCLIHFTADAPFGGVRTSGMGSYHGRYGFETFSFRKTIMRTGTWLDVPIRYAPYLDWKTRLIKRLMG